MSGLDKYRILIFWAFLMIALGSAAQEKPASRDSLYFRGQVSVWGAVNSDLELPVWFGGRFIPQANYEIVLPENRKIDFEASAHLNAAAGISPFDSLSADSKAKAYRAWMRYSGNQFEIRLGLQKINFGSASLLRPLMWFDQIDPRDPLQLTDGVWGLLGRYYFLNNANLWLWSLWGNNQSRAWDIGLTQKNTPEWGGRFQHPVPNGEAAISYHFRKADTRNIIPGLAGESHIPEHRFAFDGKWDVVVGFWVEASWIHKTESSLLPANQEMINAGADYTFGLGNGVNATFEHLLFSMEEKPFRFEGMQSLSGLQLSYPVGLNHRAGAIFYRDWKGGNQFNFVNWQVQFTHFKVWFIAFANPKNYTLPQQGGNAQLFAGKGLQIMLVYDY